MMTDILRVYTIGHWSVFGIKMFSNFVVVLRANYNYMPDIVSEEV